MKSPVTVIAAIVAVQGIILAVGWFVVYNATYTRIAKSVEEIIVDSNRRVAESLVETIGVLPSTFDPADHRWQRAQELVEGFEFGSGGFACIIDDAGNIACHPDISNDPGLRDVNLSKYAITPIGSEQKTTIGKIGLGDVEVGMADFSVDGMHYVATQQLAGSGARLLVHQPVSGFSSAASNITADVLVPMAVVGVIVPVLTGAIGFVLIRHHTKEVQAWGAQLEAKVAERTEELRISREAIVVALAKLADFRDNETGEHVLRISEYCVVLSRHMQEHCDEIDDKWIDHIRLASMLHDIGKVEVPDAVLRKPGKLTEAEFELIKRHPIVGSETLIAVHQKIENDPLIEMAVQICFYHHEKWNGTGYYGLSREDIPLAARITALADVFDALLSPRVYKPAMPLEEVCEIIHDSSGQHFDPDVVEAFTRALPELCEIRRNFSEPVPQAA